MNTMDGNESDNASDDEPEVHTGEAGLQPVSDQSDGIDPSLLVRGQDEDQSAWHCRVGRVTLTAAETGDVEAVKTCVQLWPQCVCAVDSDLYTPLHRSSYNNHIQVMRYLIQSGADVSARTSDGWTPLHCAAKWAHIEAADLLISCGADINAMSEGGNTPLHLAANHNKRALLELLLYNEDIESEIKNNSGETAYQIAKRCSPLYELWHYL